MVPPMQGVRHAPDLSQLQTSQLPPPSQYQHAFVQEGLHGNWNSTCTACPFLHRCQNCPVCTDKTV